MAAISAMWWRSLLSRAGLTAAASSTNASPVLNQPDLAIIGKIDDQNAGSSDRIQSMEAKAAEKASKISPTPLSQDSAGAIGSASCRGPHRAKAASRFHSTM